MVPKNSFAPLATPGPVIWIPSSISSAFSILLMSGLHAAFGLGQSEKGISSLDTAGMAFADIEALTIKLEDKSQEIEELKELIKTLVETDK